MDAVRRQKLEADWMTLTRRDLPQAADRHGWPIRDDHCFQRVLLDNACNGVWYDHIGGSPAYRHASDGVLLAAVTLGRAALDGRADIARLNRQSLRWRGKAGNGGGA